MPRTPLDPNPRTRRIDLVPLTPEQQDVLFSRWCLENEDAARFLRDVAYVTRLADDLADGDADDPISNVRNLLHITMARLPNNPFFKTYSGALAPVIVNAILLWDASESWRESDNRKTRMFGFVHREAVEQIAYTVAYLCGGLEHAMSVVDELHQEAHQTSVETFEQWETE